MLNNRGPTNVSFDSPLPDTPSTAVNPHAASSLAASRPATPATSPQCASASTSPRSDICGKKNKWRISYLTRSVDLMEINLDTPPTVQSCVSSLAQAPQSYRHCRRSPSSCIFDPKTKKKFQFVIAVYASPHYLNKMRHHAMSGYWNVNTTGQAVSAETFARDCLTNTHDFYTHLDPVSLHQPLPDQALINSTAINHFCNVLMPEQWIQVEDCAQQLRFNFIQDIVQLIACARHMTPQKKLAPKPGGKAEPPMPAPTPATALTTALTPAAPAAHVHVINAEAPPVLPTKHAAPNDEGGRQNGKKFKGNGNNNNQKQDYCPWDCNRFPHVEIVLTPVIMTTAARLDLLANVPPLPTAMAASAMSAPAGRAPIYRLVQLT
ncbi:hypothetical protein M427DRAFT_32353 [Gonapodya prolifera JEL478]|uniref:Uncharacterized protein n=1 Tax=Gonapodya prolifera (strain JEL478) TaxID=1344416 RepID=A0A139AEZ7_GONPJ|nr:hypothetical protein M427DRAFT_32353 [Gonapodya prolifera JEL478]|eukprot:KXS15392.1 hypothetical protein M427DRAFT_32353 [Gonapodya prolifera JEL478]